MLERRWLKLLQNRINQIQDPVTGDTVGGVKVKYDSTSNNFTFTTGTTGNTSTIKVKGASRFGLDDVALGVGTVPQIYNLVQALMQMALRFMLMPLAMW